VGAEARVTGLALSDKTDLDGTVHLSAAGGDLALTFEVHDEGKTILHGGADLPFTVTPYPFRFEAHDGPISADARFAAFPLPLSSIGIETPDPARWDGTVLLGGSAGSPTLSVDGRVAFPGWPRMSRYWADVKADLSSSPDAASPGLSVSFTLESEERALITGEAEYPLVWSLAPPQAVVPDEGVLGLSLRGDAVPLEEFDAFLPAHVGLAGMIDLRFSAEGDVRDPRLDGAIASKEITVTSSEGTRVSSKLDVKVGGSASRLSAEGNVEILSGVIRIPDTPKDLHPEEGTAVLWGNGLAVGGEETEDAPPPAEAEEAAGAAERTFDLDVNLVIPSGLWIRGRGLDVELAGDLELVQKGPYPTVTGTLEALRGRLLFLGRTFFVERGTVIFYGEDEIDPSLDLLLTTHVESMLIRILFQGTAKKPEITLQSEPEMTEGDIMSVLLFGRTLDELSSDQTGFLQKRAADVAASLGTSQLEARLSRQLGVDMVTIGKGKGGNGKTSLIVGKYLSRNVLLKYEQALEESSVFFINLEYFLTRHLKLETLIGRQSQSALEVNWSKDY